MAITAYQWAEQTIRDPELQDASAIRKEIEGAVQESMKMHGLARQAKEMYKESTWKAYKDAHSKSLLTKGVLGMITRTRVCSSALKEKLKTNPELKSDKEMYAYLQKMTLLQKLAYLQKNGMDQDLNTQLSLARNVVTAKKREIQAGKNDLLDGLNKYHPLTKSVPEAEKNLRQVARMLEKAVAYGIDQNINMDLPSGKFLRLYHDEESKTLKAEISDMNANIMTFEAKDRRSFEKLVAQLQLEGGITGNMKTKQEYQEELSEKEPAVRAFNNIINDVNNRVELSAAEKAMTIHAELSARMKLLNLPALEDQVVEFSAVVEEKPMQFQATYSFDDKQNVTMTVRGADGKNIPLRQGVDNKALLESQGMDFKAKGDVVDKARSATVANLMFKKLLEEVNGKTDKDIVVITVDGLDRDNKVYPITYAVEPKKDKDGNSIQGQYILTDHTDPTIPGESQEINLNRSDNKEIIDYFAKITEHAHTFQMEAHSLKHLKAQFKAFLSEKVKELNPDLKNKGMIMMVHGKGGKRIPVTIQEGPGGFEATAAGKPVNMLSMAVKFAAAPIIEKNVANKELRSICNIVAERNGESNWKAWLAKELHEKNSVDLEMHDMKGVRSLKVDYDAVADKYNVQIVKQSAIQGEPDKTVKVKIGLDQLLGKEMMPEGVDGRAADLLKEIHDTGYKVRSVLPSLETIKNTLSLKKLLNQRDDLNSVIDNAAKKAQEQNGPSLNHKNKNKDR